MCASPAQSNKGRSSRLKRCSPIPGHSRDVYGKLIPRYIIHTFTCTYNGEEVFRADWHPAIAANPYLAFYTVATESGHLRFEWIDDKGTMYATEAEITVV